MNAGHICLQCSKELQRNPSARAKKEGKKRYEIRDMLISPVEVRCVRCHCRLARSENSVDGPLRPVVGVLGLVFWGCESIYGGVKEKLASSSDELQGTQHHAQYQNGPTRHDDDAPPAYEDVVREGR
ncbi:(ZYRO0C10362g) [Zygosaccharomyces parabailii]|nr:(ZYRO0C10362g) [Zygosaccharomyces parabailii]